MDDTSAPSPETTAQVEREEVELDYRVAVCHLATLTLAEYDRVRKDEAKRLGIRVSTLDISVNGARSGEQDSVPDPFPQVVRWQHPVDGAALLTAISAAVRRFIACDKVTANAVALWIAFTWFTSVVDTAPIAAITSPEKRCGKTQLLALIRRLAHRGLSASSITAAALFRAIEAWQPTLLIDEADAFLRENEELRGVLNSGHTRDLAFVFRTVGDDHTPTAFSTWGAKAIAGIGKLAETLADRSIPIKMRRKLPAERVDRLRNAGTLFDELKAQLARWSDDHCHDVARARPLLPDSLNDRAQDNWEPLLQIALVAGGEWPKLAGEAALRLSGEGDDSQSLGAELLADIKSVFDRREIDKIFSADLIVALCADTESPWATWNHGKEMTQRQLARKLGEYGIVSSTQRIGSATNKGYKRAIFEDAFARYLDLSLSSVTPSQPAPDKTFRVSDVETVRSREGAAVTPTPAPRKACDVVTDKTEVTAGPTETTSIVEDF